MKYGDTLQQRSIPEWQSYNVDYNEIKKIIKERTSQPQASAIVIPGQSDNIAETHFEDELFKVLRDQHDEVDMFLRSKAGEIKRRLDHLHKLVVQLRRRTDGSAKKRIPVKRLERFSKVEHEALKTGEELQSLAQFLTFQEQAFRKLLKKYRKWTGSSRLQVRFTKEVLSQGEVFQQAELEPLLLQYQDVLETLRAPFNAGLTWSVDGTDGEDGNVLYSNGHSDKSSNWPNAAVELRRVGDSGSSLELDTALATIPLGLNAGYATYWVHPENLTQLHILMLQHTCLRAMRERALSTPSVQTPTSSRKGSTNGRSSSVQFKEDDLDLMIIDDAEDFAKRRSGMTIRDIENRPGCRPEAAITSVRFGSEGDAIIDVDTSYGSKTTREGRQQDISRAHVSKKKLLRPVVDVLSADSGAKAVSTINGNGSNGSQTPNKDLQAIEAWLSNRVGIKPLARICAKRTRFIGLNNSDEQGIWAMLDRDVTMRSCTVDELATQSEPEMSAEQFPHAVLGIRWEGQTAPGLIHVLENCHLVERVPGFSIETHAVAVLCKPSAMPAPFWSQALEKDIRKLPTNKPKPRKGSSTPESAGTRPTSTSAASVLDNNPSSGFSAAPYESPATSAPDPVKTTQLKVSKRSRRDRRLPPLTWQHPNSYDPNAPRYWNEFDDGEEAPEDEAYKILVDPNTSDPFSELWSTIYTHAAKTSEKLRSLFKPRDDISKLERQSLLHSQEHPIQDPTESDDTDSPVSPSTPVRPRLRSKYSTFPSFHQARDPLEPLAVHQIEQREVLLLRCTAGAFVASFLLFAVGAILEITRRKRYIVSADIGTLVGVIASVLFAVAGLGLSAARHNGGGWMSRVQGGLAFLLICLGNGIVVLLLVGG